MEETLEEYKQRVASSGGKAAWSGKTKEERSKIMRNRAKKRTKNKTLKEEESIKTKTS